jgi:hypothetical protein
LYSNFKNIGRERFQHGFDRIAEMGLKKCNEECKSYYSVPVNFKADIPPFNNKQAMLTFPHPSKI